MTTFSANPRGNSAAETSSTISTIALYGLAAAGAYGLYGKSIGLLKCIALTKILRPSTRLSSKLGEGSWAVVTGATDGIGKAFAINLAKKGFNLVVIGRSDVKMQKLLETLRSHDGNLHVKPILLNMNDLPTYSKFLQDLALETKDLDVSLLINNVGVAYTWAFEEFSMDKINETLNINTLSAVHLQRLFIERFKTRKHPSGIINMGSLTARYPFPFIATYSATKKFVDQLSLSLDEEFKTLQPRVNFLSANPWYVSTRMTRWRKNWDTIEPEDAAESILDQLGYMRQTSGHWRHELLRFILDTSPEFLVRKWIYKQNKVMWDGVQEVLRKRKEAKSSTSTNTQTTTKNHKQH